MATYKKGSSGSDVEKLQNALVGAGYDVGSTGADGVYGKNTEAAVKKYQQDNGLTVDGIAGKNTLGKLYSTTTPPAATPTSAGASNPTADEPKAPVAPETKTFTYDTYAPSDVVNQANELLQQWNASKPGAYQSQWDSYLNDYMNRIENREPFSYDFNADALYNQYKDMYIQQGQMAMMDTMGQAAAMTGGYGNSYAQTVGQQAYNQQLNQLNNIMPELYGMAYDKYQQEGQDLLNMYNMYLGRENQDYSRYQDELGNWYTNLDYLTRNYESERDFDYGQYADDRSLAYDDYTNSTNMEYKKYRDEVADTQWQTQFDEGVREYEQGRADSLAARSSGVGASKTENKPIKYDTLNATESSQWEKKFKGAETLADVEWYTGQLESIIGPEAAAAWYDYYAAKFIDEEPEPPKIVNPPVKGSGVRGSGGGGKMYAEHR